MRAAGWTLLVVGFVWLAAAPALLSANYIAAWSDLQGAVAHKHALPNELLMEEIRAMRGRLQQRQPWIVTPACLMLAGGVLLSGAFGRRKVQAAPDSA